MASSKAARRRAFIRAKRFALLEHGYPENWSPMNGEKCLFFNICSKTDLPIVIEAAINIESNQHDIKIIHNTIDVICPYCGRIHALTALPNHEVIETFLKHFPEENENAKA